MGPSLERSQNPIFISASSSYVLAPGGWSASRAGGGAGSDGHVAKIVRVLIVDDNVDLAENIAEILGGEGFVTVVAASAEDALAMARAGVVDVLVTDFRLPGINGAELVRRLRRERADLHAVVISAYDNDETIDDAKDAGAAFMAKPVDFGALNTFVRMREATA